MAAVTWAMVGDEALALPAAAERATRHLSEAEVDAFVADLYRHEAVALVRLARLFVDDLNAAEDLVQEAFVRAAAAGSLSVADVAFIRMNLLTSASPIVPEVPTGS